MQQQMLAQHQQPQQQASPEYLTSPQEFSPALVSYTSSLPAQVGTIADSSYSANRQVFFPVNAKEIIVEVGVHVEWSHYVAPEVLQSPCLCKVPLFVLHVLSFCPCASPSFLAFPLVKSADCYLQGKA